MEDGGQIRIFTSSGTNDSPNALGTEQSPRDAVKIGIADNGPGMDEATQAKVFNPFFTTRRGGTGLGLAIVHKIVHLHGGDVTVETEVGRGTTFLIHLPREVGVPASAC